MTIYFTAGAVATICIIFFIYYIYTLDHKKLRSKMNEILEGDLQNRDVAVEVRYAGFFDRSKILFSVDTIPEQKSYADAFRIFLRFAGGLEPDRVDDIYFAKGEDALPGVMREQFELQKLMELVLSREDNRDIQVLVYYPELERESELVYDIRQLSGKVTATDMFRVLLQFSELITDKGFETVHLRYHGESKFFIKGDYFRRLGQDYSTQDPILILRTFPENLHTPEGSYCYPRWKGETLNVLEKQMENFNDFNRKWYLNDWIKSYEVMPTGTRH